MCTSNNEKKIYILEYQTGTKRHSFRRKNRPASKKTSIIMHKAPSKTIQNISWLNESAYNIRHKEIINIITKIKITGNIKSIIIRLERKHDIKSI